MGRRWLLRGLRFTLFVIAAIAVFGFVVMHLWNWLLPALFGWKLISFWQAAGMVILSRILFGGFRGMHRGPAMQWRHRMMDHWEKMSPEERERFRGGMRRRCGTSSAPEVSPNTQSSHS
jgi:hypothetical protein